MKRDGACLSVCDIPYERANAVLLCVLTDHQRNNTPLHRAALNGRNTVVKLLLDHGADINARNKVRHRGLTQTQTLMLTPGRRDAASQVVPVVPHFRYAVSYVPWRRCQCPGLG